MIIIIFLEFSGTLFCGVIGSLVYSTSFCQTKLSIHLRIQLVTMSTVAAVVSAFHYTGGFFQPLLAFVRTFGCIGYFRPDISAYDHVFVYWVGPTTAAILITIINPFIHQKCQASNI